MTNHVLSQGTLPDLPDAVQKPVYDRGKLSAGILHFGPGNFHRAHQQIYLHDLFNQDTDLDWAIIGASIMPNDESLRTTLLAQDCLGSVVEQSAAKSTARISGAMIDYLPVGDVEAILKCMADPAIRIVSMTVTEGGYFVDAETGFFNEQHPAITADAVNIDSPKTIFGIIVNALRARRDRGESAFTVMSCDNLPHNGLVARGAVIGLARLVDEQLANWIETHASFPNGMVDRIAPATGPLEKKLIVDDHGIQDGYPVFCEDYLQWVLEDKFVNGRPQLESVGVQFVDDVTPFEAMKIRMLNGGHAVIAYPAGLLDIEFVSQAMQHPLIVGFLDKIENQEIIPTVPSVPGTDLQGYYSLISARFANPKIADTIRRLCFDGSNRQPKFIIPTLRDRIASNSSIDGLAICCALWCRYCYGETDSGTVIESNDPSWSVLKEAATAARENPEVWLAMEDVYGTVGENPVFRTAFTKHLNALWEHGTEKLLQEYISA